MATIEEQLSDISVLPEQEMVDDRVRRSKQAVIAATQKLLTEQGFAGVSVDEVSKVAGVAKTTIYRHWPNRTALLLDACATLGHKQCLPDTGTLKGDVEALVSFVVDRLVNQPWPKVLPSIIDAAERDSQIAQVHARMHAGMTTPFRLIIEKAKDRGEVPKHIHATEIVSLILGPCFYRRWFSREPLDDSFVKFVVTSAIAAASER